MLSSSAWALLTPCAHLSQALSKGSVTRAELVRAELALGALRAVEDDLGRLIEMLVAAEVRLPALLVGREPDGLAFLAFWDQAHTSRPSK